MESAWDSRSDWDRAEALEVGRTVYEALTVTERPTWAARLLRLCLTQLEDPPQQVVHVADLAEAPRRWTEAHEAFQAVRQLTLRAERRPRIEREALILYVAENVAKITYSASGAPAPFDHNAGWWLLMNVREYFAATPADPRIEGQLREAVVSAA